MLRPSDLRTVPGTYTPPYGAFVTQAATTFFAQGSSIGVYILELGVEDTTTAAISALTTWLTDNPGLFYSILVPAPWDSAGLATLAGDYANPNSKLYFFITTTQANLSLYAAIKSVIATVPAPAAPATELTAAALMYQWTAQNPSAAAPPRLWPFARCMA